MNVKPINLKACTNSILLEIVIPHTEVQLIFNVFKVPQSIMPLKPYNPLTFSNHALNQLKQAQINMP